MIRGNHCTFGEFIYDREEQVGGTPALVLIGGIYEGNRKYKEETVQYYFNW